MFAQFPNLLLRAIASCSLLMLGGTVLGGSITSPAQAQSPASRNTLANRASSRNTLANRPVRRVKFTPPPMKFNRGAPGNRGHNASRGTYCSGNEEIDSPRLTTLVPTYQHEQTNSSGKRVETDYVASLTHSQQPALWAYVPVDQMAEDAVLEFVLQNEAGEEIYQTEVTVPEQSGLLRIAPQDMLRLEEDQSYQWFLVYEITCVAGAEPEIDWDEGTIHYQAAAPETIKSSNAESLRLPGSPGSSGSVGSLTEAQPETQPDPRLELAADAAEAGYWHEALDQVAQLRQANPTAEVNEAWRSLLTDIGLESLIDAPFAPSATNSATTSSSATNSSNTN